MTASRDIDDISTAPGGKTGSEWTSGARESVSALWALNGGLLLSVSGTNTITASVAVSSGFSAYTDGLRCVFIASATNTTACTINVGAVGVKALVDPDGDPLAAGAIVSGRVTEIVFVSADDHFRLVSSGGTSNITVQGGIILQRSAPSRLVAAAGPATALTTVLSIAFQCGQADSRVIIEGAVARTTGSGTADVDGFTVGLYVDGSEEETLLFHCEDDDHSSSSFAFEYLPGDISSHTYTIRCSSTIAATYPKHENWVVASEMSPNA